MISLTNINMRWYVSLWSSLVALLAVSQLVWGAARARLLQQGSFAGGTPSTPPLPVTVSTDQTIGGTQGSPGQYTVISQTLPAFTITGPVHLSLQDLQVNVQPGTVIQSQATNFTAWLRLPWLITGLDQHPGAQLSLTRIRLQVPCSEWLSGQQLACGMNDVLQLRSLRILPGVTYIPSWTDPQLDIQDLQISCQIQQEITAGTFPNSQALPGYAFQKLNLYPSLAISTIDTAGTLKASSIWPTGLVSLNATGVSSMSHVPATGLPSPSMIAPMQCVVAPAYVLEDVAALAYHLQPWAGTLHMVLMQNTSIDTSYRAEVNGTVWVYRTMVVSSNPTYPYMTYMDMGMKRGVNFWTLTPDAMSPLIAFDSLVFTVLPIGPPESLPWSLYTWLMWAVNVDYCRDGHEQPFVVIANCIILEESDTMMYMSYWTSQQTSQFPDQRRAAAWYTHYRLCPNSPAPSFFLSTNVTFLDQLLWQTHYFTSIFGTRYINTTLVGKHQQDADGVQSHLPPTNTTATAAVSTVSAVTEGVPVGNGGVPGGSWGLEVVDANPWTSIHYFRLTQFFSDPYTPFPQVVWVTNTDMFVKALANATGPPNIGLINNVTVPATAWPAGGINLTRSVTIAGWSNSVTAIDWQGASGVVTLNQGVSVTLRQVVLLNMGRSNSSNTPLGDISLLQWEFTRPAQRVITLHATVVLLPAPELAHLLEDNSPISHALASTDSQEASYPPTFPTLATDIPGIPAGSPVVRLGSLLFDSVSADSLTLAVVPPASSQAPFCGMPFLQQRTWPQPGEAQRSRKIAIAIAVPLGIVFLAAVVAALLMYGSWRRRRLAYNQADPRKFTLLVEADKNGREQPLGNQNLYHSSLGSSGQQFAATSGNNFLLHRGNATTRPRFASFAEYLDVTGEQEPVQTSPLCWESRSRSSRARRPSLQSRSQSPQRVRTGAADPGLPVRAAVRLSPRDRQLSASFQHDQGISEGVGAMGDIDEEFDSFDAPPQVEEQLLINMLDVSRDLQSNLIENAAEVAAGLRDMVTRMQQELGSEEVQVQRVIGKGGGGVVYQGLWRGLNVAVKVVEFQVTASQPMSRAHQRAITEAALCKTLQHPNIVATYAYDLQAIQDQTSTSSFKSKVLSQPAQNRPDASAQAQQPAAAAAAAATTEVDSAKSPPVTPLRAADVAKAAVQDDVFEASGSQSPVPQWLPGDLQKVASEVMQEPPTFSRFLSRMEPSQTDMSRPSSTPFAAFNHSRSRVLSRPGANSAVLGFNTADANPNTSTILEDAIPKLRSVIARRAARGVSSRGSLQHPEGETSTRQDDSDHGQQHAGKSQRDLYTAHMAVGQPDAQQPSAFMLQTPGSSRTASASRSRPFSTHLGSAQLSGPGTPKGVDTSNKLDKLSRTPSSLSGSMMVKKQSTPLSPALTAVPQTGSPAARGSRRGSGASRASTTPPVPKVTYFRLFIIQEYCDAGTLKHAIDEHRLHDMSSGVPRPVMGPVLQLACDIAAGLAHIHSRRVIHGDLTPNNVLLRTMPSAESGFMAKIADFGLSWKLPNPSEGTDFIHSHQGTRFYVAPEVISMGIVSKAADIYSFGLLLHEMYHGTPSWRSANMLNAFNHADDSPKWDPTCPVSYRDLVMQCLAKEPNARPKVYKVVESLLAMQREFAHTSDVAPSSSRLISTPSNVMISEILPSDITGTTPSSYSEPMEGKVANANRNGINLTGLPIVTGTAQPSGVLLNPSPSVLIGQPAPVILQQGDADPNVPPDQAPYKRSSGSARVSLPNLTMPQQASQQTVGGQELPMAARLMLRYRPGKPKKTPTTGFLREQDWRQMVQTWSKPLDKPILAKASLPVSRRSSFSHAEQAPLPPLAELQPMTSADTKDTSSIRLGLSRSTIGSGSGKNISSSVARSSVSTQMTEASSDVQSEPLPKLQFARRRSSVGPSPFGSAAHMFIGEDPIILEEHEQDINDHGSDDENGQSSMGLKPPSSVLASLGNSHSGHEYNRHQANKSVRGTNGDDDGMSGRGGSFTYGSGNKAEFGPRSGNVFLPMPAATNGLVQMVQRAGLAIGHPEHNSNSSFLQHMGSQSIGVGDSSGILHQGSGRRMGSGTSSMAAYRRKSTGQESRWWQNMVGSVSNGSETDRSELPINAMGMQLESQQSAQSSMLARTSSDPQHLMH